MKELKIHHFSAKGERAPRVHVSYCASEGTQTQAAATDFTFSISDEQRHLIQWYLENYLICPWGEFCTRAKGAEALMEKLGVELFDAVFSSRETRALYTHVTDDLANTRIVIHADDTEGIALPWELMRDAMKREFGNLACSAYAFVRSQSGLNFQPSTPA
jgi:hypothetical protein